MFFQVEKMFFASFWRKEFYSKGVMYSRSNKKQNTPINSNSNYSREMKLVSINMDYCLLHFDALNFFLGVHPDGESQPNSNFF